MNVLIVDDEPLARTRLRTLVTEIGPPWHVVGEAASGVQLLERCRLGDIDLVLLDIRMPDMDGLTAAEALTHQPSPPTVIFTTAYSESALTAFEYRAVDYLLKPIRRERLQQALQKASTLSRVQLQATLDQAEPIQDAEGVCVRYRGTLKRIPLSDIFYFRAEGKYVIVRHKGGEALLEESLKQLEQRFAGHLLRIHRNALLHLHYLKGIRKCGDDEFCIELIGDDSSLEISRRHLPAVRKWLKGG